MKTEGDKKARFVAILSYHGYIFLASIAISLFFMWILRTQFTSDIFFDLFPLVFIQMEIFLWMGKLFFPPNMKENMTPGKIVINTLSRLLLFYVAVFITAVAIFFISLYVRTLFQHVDFRVVLNDFMAHQWNGFIGSVSSGLLFGIILFFFFQWKDALNREQKLKEEKLLFRYETLKNQVNPHFLFNSFNTLTSLVDNQPDVAGVFISKLSSLYRYILEKQDQDWVALTDELDFARNFFELQKIRDGERVKLEIDIPEPEKYMVLPISVQILLENVFKHNAASRENPLNVKITFEKGGYLLVSNPLRPKSTMNYSTGTGLRNLGERTRLIAGRDIRIIEKPAEFSVRIPLKTKIK